MRAPALLTLACFANCSPSLPEIPGIQGDGGLSPRYVDTVVSFGAADNQMTCSDLALSCDLSNRATCGESATNALGAPDSQVTSIRLSSTLTLASACTFFLEQGGEGTNDVRVYGSSPPGTRVVVDVSFDADRFVSLGEMTGGVSESFDFDLGRIELESFQFIRLSVVEGGPFELDAIENLRP